jgi:hypothetical protein
MLPGWNSKTQHGEELHTSVQPPRPSGGRGALPFPGVRLRQSQSGGTRVPTGLALSTSRRGHLPFWQPTLA